jgi:hypothetical protein
MQMIEEVWLKCDGASGQLQSIKLIAWHFDKSTFTLMNLELPTQVLSGSAIEMI